MKPDKHKKEKNALYKKKHGITDSNKQELKINEQFRDTKVKDKTHSACDGPSACLSDKAGKETVRSSSEETQLEKRETNYGRRKVVSNWERYEVEDSTTVTVRGSDFTTLLKSSASVFSHSQYRDELGLMKKEDSEPNAPTKFLSLDCDDLANSLMCIPLHDRLGVEISVFEPLMIQQCIELSKENASKYATALSDQMEPSPTVDPDYSTGTSETSNRIAEEQFTVNDEDLSVEICSKASSECLVNTDNCNHSPINDSQNYADDGISSSELLDSECQHKVETSTDDGILTAAVKQSESGLKEETPLSPPSASTVEEKEVAGSKGGSGQSLKELENELDLLLAL